MTPVDPVILIFAVLLGLVFGSFLNVCIVRLPRGESIATPRSHCYACRQPIRVRDNLPVLSWLLLRGRCRDCGARISVRYAVVETMTALLFALCLWRFGPGLAAVAMAAFCWLLLGLLFTDAETFLLPDALTLPGIALGFAATALLATHAMDGLLQSFFGALALAGFLWMVSRVYQTLRKREGMGMGDVKLGAMLGAWLGWRLGAVCLFLAIVVAAVGGVAIVIFSRREESGDAGSVRVPFGSFLAAAGIVTVFAGDSLLHWYIGFFPR